VEDERETKEQVVELGQILSDQKVLLGGDTVAVQLG
jgi:hypothetical protein